MNLFSLNQIKTHRVMLKGTFKWILLKWISILNGPASLEKQTVFSYSLRLIKAKKSMLTLFFFFDILSLFGIKHKNCLNNTI